MLHRTLLALAAPLLLGACATVSAQAPAVQAQVEERGVVSAADPRAAEAGAEIHQQMVVLMLDFVGGRALHEEHDEAGEDTDRDPVVRCFHFPLHQSPVAWLNLPCYDRLERFFQMVGGFACVPK